MLSIPLVVATIIGVLFVEDLPGKSVHTIITIALFVSFFFAIKKFKKLTITNIKPVILITSMGFYLVNYNFIHRDFITDFKKLISFLNRQIFVFITNQYVPFPYYYL